MECPSFRYSCLDFVFTVVGVCTYLFDVGSDLWVATEFYLHGDFFWFGLVVAFLVLSSLVVQMFSWFWFEYDRELEGFNTQSAAEKIIFGGEGRLRLSLLHVLHLGFLLRHISAVEQGFSVWWRGRQDTEYAAYVTHDLSMLRLMEAFCESAPQLVLLLYIILHSGHARPIQCVSVAGSAVSIAWSVAMYHRSLRSFLVEKAKQGWGSSALYFLWNLLLIAPRLASLALFYSALPLLGPAHFLLLWLPLFLWAWLQGTAFMDSTMGEWLYRTVVAVIWYFSWFNVAEGRSLWRGMVYHSFMVTDSAILLAWWWENREPEVPQTHTLALLMALPAAYILGLLLKGLYYYCFHPKLRPPPAREEDEPDSINNFRLFPHPNGSSHTQVSPPTPAWSLQPQAGSASQLCNKRMASLANIFYSSIPSIAYTCLPNGNTLSPGH
ncbi:hypothetical protein AGOR_G00121060 [Albula goreensis]|uniref:XK-related protein n=1 Tax=Albula goreensis TaxID=1534307 RepID=A0A8T3DF68_9TELE|nr:hypothetical protein AGOR_G00121060 [Albula goreensis]